jgi:carbonic anhydrase
LRHGFAERTGYAEAMLAQIPATDPRKTVAQDVAKILAAPQISSRITVSGWVYDTESGLLERVVEPVHPGAALQRQ